MQQFCCKTHVVIGPGAQDFLKTLHMARVMVVTDAYFTQAGLAQALAQGIAQDYQIDDSVLQDPSLELVASCTARLKNFAPDLVVALGGGSVMDCAKATVYFSGLSVPLAAVPTTSGSGAEVTDFAILTHNGVKHPLISPRLCPDYAILDPVYLEKLPRSLIADAGFDVLSHALEAYVATNATPITDSLALDAFRTAFARLPASFGGDQTARMPVHISATMAAMAFSQAGLGICHALAHSLGGQYHVPHGRLNAILLPAVVAVNAQQAGERYAALARAAGFAGSAASVAVRNLRGGLIRLRRELRLPATLAEAGIPSKDLRRNLQHILDAAMDDACGKTNPVEPNRRLLEEVLEEVAGRG